MAPLKNTPMTASNRLSPCLVASLALAWLLACNTDEQTPVPRCCRGNTGNGGSTGGSTGGSGASPATGGSSGSTGGTQGSSGSGSGGSAGSQDPANCSRHPDCRGCQECFETCVCQSSDIDGCRRVCASPDGGFDGGAPPTWPSKRVGSPPTYTGSVDNSAACSRQYATTGFEPDDTSGGRHPLFLYFVGTAVPGIYASSYDGPAALAVTEAMARRGFVALGVQYDNTFISLQSDKMNLLSCLFGPANAQNVLSAACGMPHVDCDLGIATWGHSLGAWVADMAANHDPRVRAVWTTGYGGQAQSPLSKNRFRVVNGEGDSDSAVATLNQSAGFASSECPDDGRSECLRTDGSGWIIVRQADCQTSSADHCWFENSCFGGGSLEPNWIDPASTKPFALELNADWVAQTLRRP